MIRRVLCLLEHVGLVSDPFDIVDFVVLFVSVVLKEPCNNLWCCPIKSKEIFWKAIGTRISALLLPSIH